MTKNPVGWFEIYVRDIEKMQSFYEAVFSATLQKLPNPEIEMRAFPMEQTSYGAGGALVHMPGFPTGGSGTLVYFSCDDCAVEERRVLQHGGSVQRAKFSIGEYGFISLVFDPEGTLFGLHSMR